MINISFIQPDGTEVSIAAEKGTNLMAAAIANNVNGVVATCNGSLTCGTCHVFIPETVFSLLPEMDELEEDLVDFAPFERQSGSRLSCQLTITEAMEGLKISVPNNQ